MPIEPEVLREDLRRAWDGGAWHGPSLRELLDGIDAEAARRRPIPGAHSIHELVLHVAAWTAEVARRLDRATPGLPPEGDWPAEPAGWDEARAGLWAALDLLLDVLARVDPARLDEPVGTPEGLVFTHRAMVSGALQHAAYHGGQVALLARLARAGGAG